MSSGISQVVEPWWTSVAILRSSRGDGSNTGFKVYDGVSSTVVCYLQKEIQKFYARARLYIWGAWFDYVPNWVLQLQREDHIKLSGNYVNGR